MDKWIESVKTELALDVEVDVKALLDVARIAAHSVQRPAAPLTTFLIGVACANGADLRTLIPKIEKLAKEWEQVGE